MLHEEVILLSKLINVFRHFLLVDFCCNGFLIGPLFDEIKTVAYLLLPLRTQKFCIQTFCRKIPSNQHFAK